MELVDNDNHYLPRLPDGHEELAVGVCRGIEWVHFRDASREWNYRWLATDSYWVNPDTIFHYLLLHLPKEHPYCEDSAEWIDSPRYGYCWFGFRSTRAASVYATYEICCHAEKTAELHRKLREMP